ncbi:MAG: alkaline serine protease [Terriglobia bacterium]|nr:MAG: alkaline serine protease [Terriglobia bacterium]
MRALNFVRCVLLLAAARSGAFGQQVREVQLLAQPRLGADPRAVAQFLMAAGAPIHHTITPLNIHVVRVPAPAADRIQQALDRSGLFTFVEKDQVAHTMATPNDPDFPSEWHLAQILAPAAWDISTGSAGVTVAVIDSGADPAHEDLRSKLVAGWNFLAGTANTADTQGHGTATSGTLAAGSNNGVGVSSLAWQNPIMPLVVVDSTGYASYSNMANALTYAADHGVKIVNMSLAGASASATLQNAVNYAWNKGTVLFASAGNSASSSPYYPAACDNAVAVSSTNSYDQLSGFSNYGSWIDLAAPGENILTTNNGGGYGAWSGTSFSSPVAASVGALALSIRPALSASALVSLLEQNSDDLGVPGFDTSFGWGRVNAFKVALAAQNYAADTTPPAVTISSPAPNATVSGIVTVSGVATDNAGVTKVELWIDGAVSSTGTSPAFSFSWNSAGVPNGSHTLTVKAYDAAGNMGQASENVTVSNIVPPDTQPPSVAITNPADAAQVNGNVKITVSATDNVGVTQVSIYIDGILQYTSGSAPCTYNWNTKKAAGGQHLITAKAWDAAGNFGTATSVTVYK